MGNIVTVSSGYGFSTAIGGNTRSGDATADRAFLNSAAGIAANGCLTGSALTAAEALGTGAYPVKVGANFVQQPGGYPVSCPYPAIPYDPKTVITGSPAYWYNPNMFHIGLPGYFGDSGRDTLVGPTLRVWNFSITKDTHLGFLGEAGNLEFRAEIFNVLNHPQFPTPSGTIFTNPGAPTASQLGAYGVTPNASYFAGSVPNGLPNGGQSGGVAFIPNTAGDNRQVQLALKVIF
jgi:hypothetical protein